MDQSRLLSPIGLPPTSKADTLDMSEALERLELAEHLSSSKSGLTDSNVGYMRTQKHEESPSSSGDQVVPDGREQPNSVEPDLCSPLERSVSKFMHSQFSEAFTRSTLGITNSNQYRWTTNGASVGMSPGESYDLIDFLSIIQYRQIEILPFQWYEENIGAGGTAKVSQGVSISSSEGSSVNFAFKRFRRETHGLQDTNRLLRQLLSEVYILGHPVVRHHPNISTLLGICWDTTVYGEVWPVLIFRKAEHLDLRRFMRSPEGKNLKLEEKANLCWQIGSAIKLMHSAHAVHGDLKPENILIFKDENGFSAKVTDFEYSTLFAQDDETAEITLPLSPPWTAPEVEKKPYVTFEGARTADIFSYGLICFWIFCVGSRQDADEKSIDDIIRTKKREPDFQLFIEDKIQIIFEHRLSMALAVSMLLDIALACDPKERRIEIDELPPSFKFFNISHPFKKAYEKAELSRTKDNFKLAVSYTRLRACGQKTRKAIFDSLKNRANDVSSSEIQASASYDVALCYELGFGVEKDRKEVEVWLFKAGLDYQHLQNTINMIRLDTSSLYSATNIVQSGTQPGDFKYQEGFGLIMGSTADWVLRTIYGIREEDLKFTSTSWYVQTTKTEDFTRFATIKYGFLEDDEHETQSIMQIQTKRIVMPANGHGPPTDLFIWILFVINNEDALDIRRQMIDPHRPINLGSLASKKEEERSLLEILETRSSLLGPFHPETIRGMTQMCKFYSENDWPGAEGLAFEILDIQRNVLGIPLSHPDSSSMVVRVMRIIQRNPTETRLEKVESLLLDLVKAHMDLWGYKHQSTQRSIEMLAVWADTYVMSEFHEKARLLSEKSLNFYRGAFGFNDHRTVLLVQKIAFGYGCEKRFAEGSKVLKPLVAEMTRSPQKDPRYLRGYLRSQRELALLYLEEIKATTDYGIMGYPSHVWKIRNELHNLAVRIRRFSLRTGIECEERDESTTGLKNRTEEDLNDVWYYLAVKTRLADLDNRIQDLNTKLETINPEDNQSQRMGTLMALAMEYAHKFRVLGDADALDACNIWAEQALLVSDNELDTAQRLFEMGFFVLLRYELYESLDDLDTAISSIRMSLEMTELSGDDFTAAMDCLALSLRERYARLGKLEDLDEAIIWGGQTMEAVSEEAEESYLLRYIENLCDWNRKKYEDWGDIDALNDAMTILEPILSTGLLATRDERTFWIHRRLADISQEHLRARGRLDDVDRCIQVLDQAAQHEYSHKDGIEIDPDDFIPVALGLVYQELAFLYLTRSLVSEGQDYIELASEAIEKSSHLIDPGEKIRWKVDRVQSMIRCAAYRQAHGKSIWPGGDYIRAVEDDREETRLQSYFQEYIPPKVSGGSPENWDFGIGKQLCFTEAADEYLAIDWRRR